MGLQPQHNNYATETAMHAGQQQQQQLTRLVAGFLIWCPGQQENCFAKRKCEQKLLRVLQPKTKKQQGIHKNNNNNRQRNNVKPQSQMQLKPQSTVWVASREIELELELELGVGLGLALGLVLGAACYKATRVIKAIC